MLLSSAPAGCSYVSSTGVGCFPTAGLCVSPGTFILTSPVASVFNPSGQDITTNIDYVGTLTTLSNVPIGPVQLSGSFEQEVLGRTFSTETGSWTTDVVGLSLSGPVLGNTLTSTMDPSQSSTGTTSITPMGPVFRIDSFFDVFVELSLNSVPPLNAQRGPIEVVATTPLPAALPLFATGLGAMGLLGWRRKRKSAAAIAPA